MAKKKDDFDLFIVGAGSGGVRAARLAAQLGLRVAIAEESHFGGTCVHRGCIPKKLYTYASEIAHLPKISEQYGFSINSHFNWQNLQRNKNLELKRLGKIYQKLLIDNNIQIFKSSVKLLEGKKICLVNQDNTTVSADKILIATGARPKLSENLSHEDILTSDDIFQLDKLPASTVIYGSGYIGLEFACILQSFGVRVTVVTRSVRLLRNFDSSLGSFFADHLQKLRIRVYLQSEIEDIQSDGSRVQVTVATSKGSAEKKQSKVYRKLTTDKVLWAIGREANSEQLNLNNVGVNLNKRKAIKVNENWQTSKAGIYAIGDVIDQLQLTPVAIEQAKRFVGSVFQKKTFPDLQYDQLPSAIFTYPNIATVGFSEESAREQNYSIQVFQKKFTTLKMILSDQDENVFMKLVVDQKTDQVLGIHAIGEGVADMIQCLAIAMSAGLRKQDLDETLAIHPTTSEEFINMPVLS